MQNARFNLYNIDMKYVRNLSKADKHVFSVSPQVGKDSRPFVGVVLVLDGKQYCVPLSSPKPKHESMKAGKDFSKIFDKRGKLIGVLNFNNMIPVREDVLISLDMVVRKGDSVETRAYKGLLNDQLDWCNANYDLVCRKASKLYALVTKQPEKHRALVARCCDFQKLEAVLEGYSTQRLFTPNRADTSAAKANKSKIS